MFYSVLSAASIDMKIYGGVNGMLSRFETYDKSTCDSFCKFLFGANYEKKLSFNYSNLLSREYDSQNKIVLDLRKYNFDEAEIVNYPYNLFTNIRDNINMSELDRKRIFKLLLSPYYLDMVSTLLKYDDDQWFGMVLKLFAIMDGICEKNHSDFITTCHGKGEDHYFTKCFFEKKDSEFSQFKKIFQNLNVPFLDSFVVDFTTSEYQESYNFVINVLYKLRCNMIHENTAVIKISDIYDGDNEHTRIFPQFGKQSEKKLQRKFKDSQAHLVMNEKAKSKAYSDFDMFPIFTIGPGFVNVISEKSSFENSEDPENSSTIVTRDLKYSIIVQYLCVLITLATLLDKPEKA